MRITLYSGLLKNLKGEIPIEARREYLTKQKAYERLKELSGCSFAMDDIASWERWVAEKERTGTQKHGSDE